MLLKCWYTGRKIVQFTKNWQKWKVRNFYILYRDQLWGCGNQTFFGKTYYLRVLPKKFWWKSDKLFCPTSLNFGHFSPFKEKYMILQHPQLCSEAENQKSAPNDLSQKRFSFLWYILYGVSDTPRTRKNQKFAPRAQKCRGRNFQITILI